MLNQKFKEEEIKKRKVISSKKQLSKEEIKSVREIPRIERQLISLKRSIAEGEEEKKRKEEMLKKIDPDVDLLVNNKFNLTLDEIKAELSKKLQDKEFTIQRQLQNDLEDRRRNFEIQYRNLEKKFFQKYEDKVKISLQNDIKTRFDEILKKRIADINKRIQEKSSKKLKAEQLMLKKEDKKKIGEFIEKEKEKEKKVKLTEKKLEGLKKDIKKDEAEYKKKLCQRLEKQKRTAIEKTVKEQSEIIRKKLKEEFDQRLMLEIKAKEAEFEKKKADLTLDIQKRAKQFFS